MVIICCYRFKLDFRRRYSIWNGDHAKWRLIDVEAVFANSVTVSGQIFQITPGGIGNYESFLVFALRLFGFPIQEGYTIAIVTHAVKFFFSYAAGAMAVFIYPIPFKTVIRWIKVRGVRGR